MLTCRIIPCLDVKDGRVVKGVKFQGLRDVGDPVELATRYEQEGGDELTLLDVSATPEGRGTMVDTVAAVRKAISIPLTVGGGVRTADDVGRLLDVGADKVGVNTAAVADPELLTRMATRFGRQCTVLAIDAASDDSGGWRVVTRSGSNRTARDAVAWAREGAERGAGEILLTSWDRDGTRSGYDLELLSAMRTAAVVPIIASGGADSAEHMAQAFQAGADAALAASIFHDQDTSVAEVKRRLAGLGIRVRA